MRGASASVLIVSDEPEVCSSIRSELAPFGFDCSVSADATQAKQLLAERKFDLLIADIAMPEVSGLDLLICAQRDAPGCKVVLITDSSNREELAQALILGAYDYLEKAFLRDDLNELAERASREELEPTRLPFRAAAAMESNARSRKASLESVRALIRAVEAKDPFTRRHSEHVVRYAVSLTRALKLDGAAVDAIGTASLLHDIGKIGVPDRILTKPGPLTEEEFEFIRRHPAVGSDILAKITPFGQEARLVRHHHERWDGKGYPDGLTGEESPLGARIIMVADCIDAMLMPRSYKSAYPMEKMIDELIRCAGTQFDPQLARAAVQWCRMHPGELVLPGRPVEPGMAETAETMGGARIPVRQL